MATTRRNDWVYLTPAHKEDDNIGLYVPTIIAFHAVNAFLDEQIAREKHKKMIRLYTEDEILEAMHEAELRWTSSSPTSFETLVLQYLRGR